MTTEYPADSDGLNWCKSSHSDTEGANCVEVATCPGVVYVRDSKDKEGPRLAFGPGAWAHFTRFAAAFEV